MNQKELLNKINYLNMAEIGAFCKLHGIPLSIYVEGEKGRLKRSKDKDRKGVILDRIRHFIRTRKVLSATIYGSKVCSNEPLENITPKSKLHYGQYDKYNRKLIVTLKSLTNGEFRNGSIAREVMRDFWTKGKAPTLVEFSKAWMKAVLNDTKNHGEWAFLTDLASGESTADWKEKRNEIARDVLAALSAGKNL